MQINALHSWDVSPKEAVRIQKKFLTKIQLQPLASNINMVAGADVSYNKGSDQFYAGVIVLQFPELIPVEEAVAIGNSPFPYIPGLLSFREAPILLQAFQKLRSQPDVILFDGQGIAHPRRMGIASHVGLFLDCPTVGCAKHRLTGEYCEQELSKTAGSALPLKAKDGTIIGTVLRTKTNIKPVFVSPGYKADIPTATALVLKCCKGYKLPEPTRLAHHLVNRVRTEQTAYAKTLEAGIE